MPEELRGELQSPDLVDRGHCRAEVPSMASTIWPSCPSGLGPALIGRRSHVLIPERIVVPHCSQTVGTSTINAEKGLMASERLSL